MLNGSSNMKRLLSGEFEFNDEEFTSLDFQEQTLNEQEFYGCTFNSCNFSGTEFSVCRFNECTFNNCNLSLVLFSNTNFSDVGFNDCKMLGIDWTRADWPRINVKSPVNFHRSVLNGSSFNGLFLGEMQMIECVAHDVDFAEADCNHADFSSVEFTSSIFHRTNLNKAIFIDALDYEINVTTNLVKGAEFSLPEAASLFRSLGVIIRH